MTELDQDDNGNSQLSPLNGSYLTRSRFRLLRFGFHLLYNEMAWTYDSVSWLVSLGHWREWQRCAIPYLEGHLVLEIAHGPGHLMVDLRQGGFQAYGLDLSPYMGRQARKNLRKANQSASLTRGDVGALPYASGSFESVVSTFPAEFIIYEDSIRELKRILVPGGRIVIVPEARLKGDGLLHRFIGWLFTITGQRADPADDGWLAQLWTEAERRFQVVGLATTIEKVDLDNSEVMVVVLTSACEKDLQS